MIDMNLTPRWGRGLVVRVSVAAGVALLAACGAGEDAGEAASGSADVTADPRTVAVALREWSIQMDRDTVRAGDVVFRVTNAGTTAHAFEVEGEGIEEETDDLGPGAAQTITVHLVPGTYEVYCPVRTDGERHKAKGMRGTLVVTP